MLDLGEPSPPTLEEGWRLADGGKTEEAARVAESCLALDPLSAEAHYLLAMTHLSSGRVEEADQALERVLYLDPDHAGAVAQLAILAEERGDSARAFRLRRQTRRIGRRRG